MSIPTYFRKALLLVATAFISAHFHPALADGYVSGTDNNAALRLQYTFTGGGIKDWNKISVTITVDGEREVDETVKSSTLPSLKGSYTVAEGDKEIEVNVYGFTEWWHPMGGGNCHLSFTVRYKVVVGEVKSEK